MNNTLNGSVGTHSSKQPAKPRKSKPRRLNLQTQDKDQAHARLILKASVRHDTYARSIEAAIRLLKMRIHREDVAAMTGLTLTQLGALAKSSGATQTTGCKVTKVGMLVHAANDHIKASAFLCMLEAVITADENLSLTAEVFLAAIDAFATLWHHDLVPIPHTTYHCLAERFVEKRIHLTDCPRCESRYLQLPFRERDPKFNLEGDCPQCRLLTSLMTTRPTVQNGVPVMKSVSRIRRTIDDHVVTGKAHRLVMAGHGMGATSPGAHADVGVRRSNPVWWNENVSDLRSSQG
ncbi:hypothetical protein ACQHIH_22025 (plasmid) [Xanthomonas sontii]|uniref:Transcriptional regulator n=1 Tax=Xanthomonas sacchari TaxID=56458 RepID=A0ABT3DUX0_9XANT|nr:hypothetical protein [Xanthomonas sacchari]MCW0399298.1 hypothetical protein [Xanthomonas sacchari]